MERVYDSEAKRGDRQGEGYWAVNMVQKEARCKIAVAAGFIQFSLQMFLLCLAISSLLRLNLFTFVISLFQDYIPGELVLRSPLETPRFPSPPSRYSINLI